MNNFLETATVYLDAALRVAVVATLLFCLRRWSNDRSRAGIGKQDMRPAKAAGITIFGVAFLLAMNIAGVPLTSLAVLTGALGVGIGFGLQKIASNFVSGVILLQEGQATVGDYVELDGGETAFLVSYDTAINRIPDITYPAAQTLPFVLDAPEPADVELAGFGDSGSDFVLEYWVSGIDDGKSKDKSHVLFAIWNALKAQGIEIPYPQRVVEIKGSLPAGVA